MYLEEIRRAVRATPRGRLDDLALALWKSHAAGAIGDDDAQALAELIKVRKHFKGPTEDRRRLGSRARSLGSIERRRRGAAQGWMPPKLVARFTLSEQAALAIVASRWALTGRCEMTMGEIAGRAGCCITVVQNALREAAKLGLVTVEERRVSYHRNLPNVVKIISPDWRVWLRNRGTKRDAEGGFIFPRTPQQTKLFTPSRSAQAAKTEPRRQAERREFEAERGARTAFAGRSLRA